MTDPLSITASIVAVLQMTATVTQYLKDVKGGSEDRTRLRDEMRSTICLLEMLKDRIEDADTRDTWLDTIRWLHVTNGPLIQFKEALELLAKKLAPSSRIRQMTQPLRWPFDKADVNELFGKIERLKSLFSLAMQNDHIKLSRAIRDNVQEMSKGLAELQIAQQHQERRVQEEQRQRMLAWISPLRFWSKQNDMLSRKQEGTCKWFFETAAFQNWLIGKERTLWCPGIPGAGKTILAATIINYLQRTFTDLDIGIAFVYCNYKEKEEQTTIPLIASLLRQLIERCPATPEEVWELYKQHDKLGTRPSLLGYSQLLQVIAAKFSKIFLVIDALDECNDDDGTRTSLIGEIRRLPPSLHLLCTSRQIRDIEQLFIGTPRQEIRASDTDVGSYVMSSIEQNPRLKKQVLADATLLEEITRNIVAKVDGMFLLAQLHVESVGRKHDRKAIRSALKHLPTELDNMYDEALERIFSQNRDDALLAERVLSWISFAERPLSVTEVQHAIAVLNLGEDETQIDEEGLPDEDLLIAVCAGVVTIDGGNSVIRLIHYTAQQYFERIRDTRFPHAQTEIARACLRYQSLDISINGYCRSRYDLQCRQQEYPLLQYAAQHWGHHASGNSEHVLMGQILAFISNRSCASWSIQTMAHTPWSLFKSIEVPAENGLWLAAGFGLKEIVKVLLQGETDVEDIGPLRETALHIASLQGHTEVVQLLLDHNADVKAINAFGMTALHNAASGGHEKIIRLLLRRGANIHAKDHGRETALYKAAESGRLAVVRLLLGNGADIKVGTPEKFSIIDAAASAGHLLVLQLLLDNDANIFAENKYRVRVLFRAADSNSEEVFHLLEDHCRKNDVPEEILETARKVLNGCEYRVMCDHCEAGILNSNAHYHCSICDHDNFDLCQRCLDDGNICHSESHSLTKRTFSGDEMVEIPS